MWTRRQLVTCLLTSGLGLILAVAPAAGGDRDAVAGHEGELYFIRDGSYGELFPGQGLADPGNAVLAVDVIRPGQSLQRLLVPGTESEDVEDSTSILFEDQSGTLFVLWHTWIRAIHSRLTLMGFRGGDWTEPIEISGSAFGWKSSPQLAVSRDTFRTLEGDGSLRVWTRTVAHLLWWEEDATGHPNTHYSPITFVNGVYTGWNPVYSLSDLVPAIGDAPSPLAATAAVAKAPTIEAGGNNGSVVLAFVASPTGELTTLAVEPLPGEMAFIADKIRAQISEIGRNLLPDQPQALAAKVQGEIADVGARLGLHPGLAGYLAEQAYEEILAADPTGPLASLAEKIRAQISEIGSRMTDRGFDGLAKKSSLSIIEFPSGSMGAPATQIRVMRTSARPAPATGTEDVSLHLSGNGREVLVSWLQNGVIFYRESRGQGWSEVRPLRLGNELDLERARELLERRADERSDE